MINIIKTPAVISFAGNPIIYEVQGDNRTSAGTKAYFELLINSFDMAYGRSFNLNFAGRSLRFISAIDPEYDGLQFKVAESPISTNPSAFAANIFDALSINYDIQNYFNVTLGPFGINERKIIFEAREIGSYQSVTLSSVGVVGVSQGANIAGTDAVFKNYFSLLGLIRDPSGKLLGEDQKSGSPDGGAIFDFSEYFASIFSLSSPPRFEFPEAAGNLAWHNEDFILSFQAAFAESIAGSVKGLKKDSSRYVISGGLSRELAALLASQQKEYFALPENKRHFLSWLPLSKKSKAGMLEKLFFLFQDDPNLKSFQVICVVTFTDATTQILELCPPTSPTQFSVLECKVSFDHLGLATLQMGKAVRSWEVFIADQDGEPVSEMRKFINDTHVYENDKCFFFRNSFSAYDSFLFTGDSDVTLEYQRNAGELLKEENFNFFNSSSKQFKALETFSCKTNSGWLSLEEKNYLRELLLSNEVYEVKDGELFQVMIKTAKVSSFIKDGDFLYNLEIEYERAYQNMFYSAHAVTLTAPPVPVPLALTWDNITVTFDEIDITFDQIEF